MRTISGEGWAGEDLFPTLEVRSAHPNTIAYLTHNTVPVEITDEDLEHVRSNNMVTKGATHACHLMNLPLTRALWKCQKTTRWA